MPRAVAQSNGELIDGAGLTENQPWQKTGIGSDF
jgi:hypothetical protein